MKYIVDGWNNFCRIFLLPKKFSNAYCFGNEIITEIKMVDWFKPIPGLPQPAISKEIWLKECGSIDQIELSYDEIYETVVPFVLNKVYIIKERKYLILFNFEMALVFTA